MANKVAIKESVDSEQRMRIDVKNHSSLSTKLIAIGSAAVVVAGVVLIGHDKFGIDLPFLDQNPNVAENNIQAKMINLQPANITTRAIATYVVDQSSLTLDTHGFAHQATMENGKVIAMIGTNNETQQPVTLPDGTITDMPVGTVSHYIEQGTLDNASHYYRATVYVDVSSIVTNLQYSEPDTKVIDTSSGITEALTGAATIPDTLSDGICYLVTAGNCDSGAPHILNPGGLAVDTSREDQATTEQALRVSVLNEIQQKCLPSDWDKVKAGIVESYKDQAKRQGADPSLVDVVFVNNIPEDFIPKPGQNKPLMSPATIPDFTKSYTATLENAGVITGIADTYPGAKPSVECS